MPSSSLPAIASPRGQNSTDPNAPVTPRRELVIDYKVKHKAHASRLEEQRRALLEDNIAQAEAERERKEAFRRDIEAQIEEQKANRDAQRADEKSPNRGSVMRSVGDEATNRQLARQKAREALLDSEVKLKELRLQKEAQRARDMEEETMLHKKSSADRMAELDADRKKRADNAEAMLKHKRESDQARRSQSKEREAKLKEERAAADQIALLAHQQRLRDEEVARYNKRIISDINAEVARNSGRRENQEKAAEREMRRELEENERKRQQQEHADKLAAKQRFREDIEADAEKRATFRASSTDRKGLSPRNAHGGILGAEAELAQVKAEQAKRQNEYREALERQIQEQARRRKEQLLS